MLEQRINRVLNRALAESGKAQALCTILAGRRLRVVMSGSPFAGSLACDGAALHFALGALREGEPADASITGSALSLAALMGERQRELLRSGTVQIAGDGEIAAKFSELATVLKPDVEHELAGLFGRVPAHLLLSGVRSFFGRGKQLVDSQLHNAADYLAHERQALVPKAEAEHFYTQVDQLREQVDRTEALITALEHRQSALSSPGKERL
jgi:ubiquinone biosynthesis protein UbiJ